MSGQRPTPNAQRPTPKDFGARRGYDLEDRLLEFAARVVKLTDNLPSSRAGNHIAGQLLRSGTAPLPNHGEADAAESRNDFIHKMLLCLKELRESRRWLRLVIRVPMVEPPSRVESLVTECEELIRIFFVSVRTARDNGAAIVREVPEWKDDMEAFLARWWIEENEAGNPCLREREELLT
jgi:four helix bundle protein